MQLAISAVLNKNTQTLASLALLTGLSAFICFASRLSETSFLDYVASLEKFGTGLALLESLFTAALAGLLFWNIRTERRTKIWIAGLIIAALALAANMSDYFGTLQLSPDLDMEVSPIWNGLLHDTGMQFAKLFGLFGKVFVSILAGASVMFYLRNVHRLRPAEQQPLSNLLFHLGEQHHSLLERFIQFATVFAFYFAGANLFCFYVVFANSLVTNLHALSQLPPFPAAVCAAMAVITGFFLIVTHQLLKSRSWVS